MWRPRRKRAALLTSAVVAVAAVAVVMWPPIQRDAAVMEVVEGSAPRGLHDDDREVPRVERDDALRRAQVWRPPRVPVAEAGLAGPAHLDRLSCHFKVTTPGGTTPKFDCVLESGEEVRIKYGKGPEVPAEAAATRLLTALGFGADEIVLVERLRCYGCPVEPFATVKAADITRAEPLLKRTIDYTEFEEFEWVALERKFDARPIETADLEGWSFFELDTINPARGGAPRAHVDGLRLMAVLLAHWDNKPDNQRLVCLSREWPEGTPCPAPFALIQDVGGTFGPLKVDFDGWARTPVWEDRAACLVSMRTLPYDGATFNGSTITERGRLFIGGLLAQLSEAQIEALFTGARFDRPRGLFFAPQPASAWVRVFTEKIRQITEGPACPQ